MKNSVWDTLLLKQLFHGEMAVRQLEEADKGRGAVWAYTFGIH